MSEEKTTKDYLRELSKKVVNDIPLDDYESFDDGMRFAYERVNDWIHEMIKEVD